MTTYQQPRAEQLPVSTATTSTDTNRVNCVVAIITDDDSDADTLKDSGPCDDRRDSSMFTYGNGRPKAPLIKHIASSSSVCTMDTENQQSNNCLTSHKSQTQLNGGSTRSDKCLGGRPYSGSTSGNTGCVPILLSVPSAGTPRRRHSWICG